MANLIIADGVIINMIMGKASGHVFFLSFAFLFLSASVMAQGCNTPADIDCSGDVNLTEVIDYIDLWYSCSSCYPDLFQAIQAFYQIPVCGDGICSSAEDVVSCEQDCKTSDMDSVLHLGSTGYAYLPDSNVSDLDYSKDFSVEVITNIEPHSSGGRWASFVQKASRYSLYNPAYPGFAIGTSGDGNIENFGKRLAVKVGDGTNHVTLSSPLLEGDAYAVMTWDSLEKALTLYINGEISANSTNSDINPLDIENDYDLQIGKGLNTLNRDVFASRLWNRRLSPAEVATLYDNYDDTGQHALPSGFSATGLVSEWLMH